MRQKQRDSQGEINKSNIRVAGFNTSHNITDRSSTQKTSETIFELNNTINHLNLIDIYRLLYPTTVGCTIFSSSHGTFTKINYFMGHKSHLKIFFKKVEIIQCLFLDHNGIKLEIKTRHINGKIIKYLGIKQHTFK